MRKAVLKMKIGFSEVNIDPIGAYQTAGFAIEKAPSEGTDGSLYVRMLRLNDGKLDFALLTMDSLGVDASVEKELSDTVRGVTGAATKVVIACTHTHFAPSLCSETGLFHVEPRYLAQVKEAVARLAGSCELKEADLRVAYSWMPFDGVGTTRISGKDPRNVYAGALSLFDGENRLGALLFYNCHPTIPQEDSPRFTSEYPGRAVEKLKAAHPGEFFTFLQGADGDVSTRFTRREKSMAESIRLGGVMADCFEKLLARDAKPSEAGISYAEDTFTIHNVAKTLPELPADKQAAMTPKELREYKGGLAIARRMAQMDIPATEQARMSRLSLDGLKLIFAQWEIFSDYNDYIDKDNTLLVCYSNGMPNYLTKPGNTEVSYEVMMELQTEEDKLKVVEEIKTL